ncbi:hypothetical protein GQ53DRAFT_631399 [Thozetella sp. PMI_491]|nr:hypothetical protein GQ53DRAFT_631399 [Thozetella sp. PMI_491]
MATAAQMASLTEVLRKHSSALDKPVTEIAIFKLKEMHTDATTAEFEKNIIANTFKGTGIKRMAWGYSLSDPKTLVWMLDWVKIQDHWDFWQTPEFGPVISTITNLFIEGRPLVRHYDFRPPGMLDQEFLHIRVWDEGESNKTDEEIRATLAATDNDFGGYKAEKGAYAVDMGEMNWYCTLTGYEDEDMARAAKLTPRGETHLLQLKYYNDLNNGQWQETN